MDSAGQALLALHDLHARSTTDSRPAIYKVIGILLAACSGLFIGVSFVLKKTGLLQANKKYNESAGEGYGYLRNWLWWTGMTLMIVGEICNFVAYAFVDAILVTPLGALSVVVTTILSAIFLKERLSIVGKIGCFGCIIGSVVIVLNAPTESSVATIQEMQAYVIAPGFLTYAGIIIVGAVFAAFWAGPRYGKKSMMVYLSICSWVGGLSVVATQGLGAAIVTQIGGTPQFNHWFIYVLLVFVICTLLTEIIFLNKALNLFNAALVTPTYYVYFTSTTIITSAILFRGFSGTAVTLTSVVMGFLQICTGVVLLQLAKSSKDVPDAAVFSGDLDQVRTIAEQEEPEFEPRADTIRGGGALLRALSTSRHRKEVEEVKTLHRESMAIIAENEVVEWDGLRRRKTVIGPNTHISAVQRVSTIHPPLGMSKFPDDVSDAGSDDVHPGFPRFGRNSTRRQTRRASPSPVPMSGIVTDRPRGASKDQSREHVYGLPSGLRKPQTDGTDDQGAWGDPLHDKELPPRPPPHLTGSDQPKTARRAFSFQAVFNRNSDAGSGRRVAPPGEVPSEAPSTPSRLGFAPQMKEGMSRVKTEEENLGLVRSSQGGFLDSSPVASPERPLMHTHRREGSTLRTTRTRGNSSDEEWQITGSNSAQSYSPPPANGDAGPDRGPDGARDNGRRGYQRGRYVESDDEDDFARLGPVQRGREQV